MKLPTAGGVITVFGDQEEARKCKDNTSYANKNVHAFEAPESEDTEGGVDEEPQEPEGVSPAEHTNKVSLCEDVPDRMVIIGKGLKEAEESRLVQFL